MKTPDSQKFAGATMSLIFKGALGVGAIVMLLFNNALQNKEARKFELASTRKLEMAALWELHLKSEFEPGHQNTTTTMKTMCSHPYVNHVPTIIGGDGKESLSFFYNHHFITQNPKMDINKISRTVGHEQLVDEMVISFNHTKYMDWLVPGVVPRGRHVEVPIVVVVHFTEEDGHLKISSEHIYWDQASVLFQLGVLSSSSVCKIDIGTLDITGIEQAKKVIDSQSVPSNELLKRTGRYHFNKNQAVNLRKEKCTFSPSSDDEAQRTKGEDVDNTLSISA